MNKNISHATVLSCLTLPYLAALCCAVRWRLWFGSPAFVWCCCDLYCRPLFHSVGETRQSWNSSTKLYGWEFSIWPTETKDGSIDKSHGTRDTPPCATTSTASPFQHQQQQQSSNISRHQTFIITPVRPTDKRTTAREPYQIQIKHLN